MNLQTSVFNQWHTKNNCYKHGFIHPSSHGTIWTVQHLPPATVYSNSMRKFNVTKLMENTSHLVFHRASVPINAHLASPVQRTRNHIICNIPYLTIVSSCKSQETIAYYKVLISNHTGHSQKQKFQNCTFQWDSSGLFQLIYNQVHINYT